MAKELTFLIQGKEFKTEPTKIERKKVYGWSEIHAFDDDGNECTLVSMDESGTVIIPKSGIGLGILGNDGNWVDRSQIKTIKLDGTEAVLTISSYSKVNELTQKVSNEEFLDYSITAFYHLENADEELISFIGNDIYKFDYCYRDSYETSEAFVLTSDLNGKKELFLMIGVQNIFEFISLEEVSVAEEEDIEEEEDNDDIDFSMF